MKADLILKEIRKGNKKSFESLFNSYYEPLVLFGQKYLYDRALSEDIVQDVFVHFWENSSSLDIKSSIKGYLFAMVKNSALDYLKSLKIVYDLEIIQDTVQEDQEENFQYPEQNTHEILFAVDNMPHKMKEIFCLKYLQNYSYNEISGELNISVNTVKTQLKRAKSLLHNQFPFLLVILSIFNKYLFE